jgi:hypothetical protein
MDIQLALEPSGLDGLEIIELDSRLDLAIDSVGLSNFNGLGCVIDAITGCGNSNCVCDNNCVGNCGCGS